MCIRDSCYSMSEDTSVTEPEGVVVKTKAEFASGEVAYLLDGTGENRVEAPVWDKKRLTFNELCAIMLKLLKQIVF